MRISKGFLGSPPSQNTNINLQYEKYSHSNTLEFLYNAAIGSVKGIFFLVFLLASIICVKLKLYLDIAKVKIYMIYNLFIIKFSLCFVQT